jgi:hypothetical protein
MRVGTVKVADISGLNNKIYKPGDEVTERNFPIGNFERLVKAGFIAEGKEAVAAPQKPKKK